MIPLKDTIPSRRFPIINYGLIILNTLIFIYEITLNDKLSVFFQDYALIPNKIFQNEFNFDYKLILPFFTHQFLHGNFLHLFGNMLFLYIFGDNVEDVLGHLNYLFFYLICGILAGFIQILFITHSGLPLLGASGAIAGILGAYFVLFPNSKIITLVFLGIFISFVEIPSFIFLFFFFLIQFLNVAFLSQFSSGIAWWAHISGFLAGFILIKRFSIKKRKGNK
ncbi:MAG: rhomboid family intramembrane serine protease [Armatimonadetes bacterium]|nr:rhomboid family intramembrane serine protease [Armatimonadota bacterium]